jgi:hypothetical protein
MPNRNQFKDLRREPAKRKTSATKPPARAVPEIYEVIIQCRHEREQRAVYERMRGEGFQCRVLTL